MLKLDLVPESFEVEVDGGKFTFKYDSRVPLKIGFATSVEDRLIILKETLIKIDNIKTGDGEAKLEDFFRLPPAYLAKVFLAYTDKIAEMNTVEAEGKNEEKSS